MREGANNMPFAAIRLQNQLDENKFFEDPEWKLEHAKLHEKHRGHEEMHFEMFMILIFTLIVAQIFLVQWKRRHFKSYQLCTLVGMWLIPFGYCLHRFWWRFLVTWLAYSFSTLVIWYKSTRSHISGTTPRLVYKWFVFLHNMSYILGIVGYILMVSALLGVNIMLNIRATVCIDFGLLFLFYGIYYGVLGRDFAHICTDRIASKIGYSSDGGLPKRILEANVCAVCDNSLGMNSDESSPKEAVYRLSCTHIFHEFCIRGWCIIGKRQICPYCKEKVDLKRMFKNPWEKPHLFYGRVLDLMRYLVVWQPVILSVVEGINKYLGLE